MQRSPYALEVGARLRATRMALGLSLTDVGKVSRGQHKPPVIGSYERADRTLSVTKLAELAEFYKVPVASLLPEETPRRRSSAVMALAEAIRDAGAGCQNGREVVRLVRKMMDDGELPGPVSRKRPRSTGRAA